MLANGNIIAVNMVVM